MHSILAQNVQYCVGFWGSAPDPAGGAYDAPPDLLVGTAFLPSVIPASRLRRLQFLQFTCPSRSPLSWRLQHLNSFTFNMSHYLKSLKICPGLQLNTGSLRNCITV